jgi:hypothetical protein
VNPGPRKLALYDRRLFVAGDTLGGMARVLEVLRPVSSGCGLGWELALVLAPLLWWRKRRRRADLGAGAAAAAMVVLAFGAAPARAGDPELDLSDPTLVCGEDAARATLRERFGVEVVGIHLTAAGHMVDFRYRVLDPPKAAPLLDRRQRAELVDAATGAVLAVPQAPKIGTLRQNTANPRAGQVAFALFANPRRLVRSGSKVTVRIGEFAAEGLAVQ